MPQAFDISLAPAVPELKTPELAWQLLPGSSLFTDSGCSCSAKVVRISHSETPNDIRTLDIRTLAHQI